MAQPQINGTQILVGKPIDGTYGVAPSNINVPGISSTDNLPSAIDKLIGIIDKLAPAKSPRLDTKYLSPTVSFGPYTARHTATNSIWNPVYGATISATAGTTYSSIYITSNPVVFVSDSPLPNQGLATFSDGQSGRLLAYVDGYPVGYRDLDSTYYGPGVGGSPDVNTWGSTGASGSGGLTITFDQDPYSVAPNTGFWTSLKATMSSTYSFSVDGNEHFYSMNHTTTGNILTPFKFIYDNNITTASYSVAYTGVPTVSGVTFSISMTLVTQSSTRWISGVPSLSAGDYIVASYSIPNNGGLISRFYNQTQISKFRITASQSVEKSDPVSAGATPSSGYPTAYQNPYRVNGITSSFTTGMFSSASSNYDTSLGILVFSPFTASSNIITGITFGSVTSFTGRKLYIDTVSNESVRVRSGDGQYPTFGTGTYSFGATYSPTFSSYSINDPTNYPQVCGELMLQNGIFRSPFGDWSNNYPVSGPTYSPLNNNLDNAYQNPNGTYWRWATFNVGTITNVTSFIITINNATNLSINGTSPYVTAPNTFAIYVTIQGASVGWLDLNKIYQGGNPSSDGDACYDNGYDLRTQSIKKVTLGTSVTSGTVYVRIGLPTSSPITFTGVTKS
jgi:hypothetical protein